MLFFLCQRNVLLGTSLLYVQWLIGFLVILKNRNFFYSMEMCTNFIQVSKLFISCKSFSSNWFGDLFYRNCLLIFSASDDDLFLITNSKRLNNPQAKNWIVAFENKALIVQNRFGAKIWTVESHFTNCGIFNKHNHHY